MTDTYPNMYKDNRITSESRTDLYVISSYI